VKLTVRKKDVFELEENENNFLNKKSWKPCGDYKKNFSQVGGFEISYET
jgi:hypothetical protein